MTELLEVRQPTETCAPRVYRGAAHLRGIGGRDRGMERCLDRGGVTDVQELAADQGFEQESRPRT